MKPILLAATLTLGLAATSLRAQGGADAPTLPPLPADAPTLTLPDGGGAPEAAPEEPEDKGPLSQANMQALMTAESFDAFNTKLAELSKQGISPQIQTELTLVHCFQAKDWANLTKALPAGDLAAAPYKTGDSKFFETADLYHSFLLLCRGSIELSNDKAEDAKKTFIDAIWLAPDHAPIVAEQVSEYRKKDKMSSYKMPLDTKLKDSRGKETTLADLVKGKKALLIDFWASWCGPCMKLMPELAEKAKKLEPQGVVVVGMNTENEAEKAEKVRGDQKMNIPWLMEPDGDNFSKALEINSIPRMVLVSPEGVILYNGHPMDPSLKDALAKVDAKL